MSALVTRFVHSLLPSDAFNPAVHCITGCVCLPPPGISVPSQFTSHPFTQWHPCTVVKWNTHLLATHVEMTSVGKDCIKVVQLEQISKQQNESGLATVGHVRKFALRHGEVPAKIHDNGEYFERGIPLRGGSRNLRKGGPATPCPLPLPFPSSSPSPSPSPHPSSFPLPSSPPPSRSSLPVSLPLFPLSLLSLSCPLFPPLP